MLSRLLSARTGSFGRSLLSNQRALGVAAPMQLRTFKTAFPLKNPDTPATPAAPAAMEPSEIVLKYGGHATFFGMIAAIAVNKELFVLDAEFLLACHTVVFVLGAYTMLGNTWKDWQQKKDDETTEKFNAATDFVVDMVNQYKMVQSTAQYKPEVLKQYATEYKESVEALAAYQTVVPQQAARSKMLASLEALKVREASAEAEEWEEDVDDIVDAVTAAFESGDATLQNEMFEYALNNISMAGEADRVEEGDDPVKKQMFLAASAEE